MNSGRRRAVEVARTRATAAPSRVELEVAWQRLSAAGHQHLFDHWEARPADARRKMEDSLRSMADAALELVRLLGVDGSPVTEARPRPPEGSRSTGVTPAPVWVPAGGERETLRATGEERLRLGACACLTVAGGQGTRLGASGPKGVFPISPLRRASLFQLFAEKLLAAKRRYGAAIPWLVMTSPLNHDETVAFFERNAHFGLPSNDVTFFPQGMNPVFDDVGRLALAVDGGLLLSPDGHGGVLKALRAACAQRLEERAIRHIFYGQVDNPLLTFPDPMFLGAHLESESQLSTKVIARRSADERMGVACLRDGVPHIVEYTDIDSELASARDDSGNLRLAFGSIAAHIMDVPALFDWESDLPLHTARKEADILTVNEQGVQIERSMVIKYERFVFDAIPNARGAIFFGCDRDEEFAPLKNQSGDDSIETCQQGQSNKFRAWCEQIGIAVSTQDARGAPVVLEVSPLFADSAPELKARLHNTVTRIDESRLFA